MHKNVFFVLASVIAILWIAFIYQSLGDRLFKNEHKTYRAAPIKNGPIRTYSDNGKLKTLVNYKQGKKEGISYLYHEDGETVQLEMPYVNDERQGTSKKYYTNGNLYAATPYENDKLHGVRKTYYRNGNLKASIPYRHGYPGTGLQEYFTDGSKKELPKITHRQRGNLLYLGLSKPCKQAQYYLGKLIDNQFFDEISAQIKILPEQGGVSSIDLNVFTPSYLQYQDIICHCKSSQAHPVILVTHIDVSSLKIVN